MPSLSVIMAFSLPHILGGTYVVETVFAYPGLGTLSFESAMYKDLQYADGADRADRSRGFALQSGRPASERVYRSPNGIRGTGREAI